jgi:4-hydroxy-2-oxoglutarate aldolase
VIRCPGRMDKLAQALSLCDEGVKPDFLILDGVMHDLPAWKKLDGHGTVSGISNIAPSSTVRLWTLYCVENRSVEQDEELREVLNVLSKVDAVVMPLGFRGLSKYLDRIKGSSADFIVEYVLGYLHGYGRCPRRPLLTLDEKNGMLVVDLLAELLISEKKYE